MTSPEPTLHKRTIASALWAAAGDALGFMSELVDESGLRYRIGASSITGMNRWKRKIGGRYGAMVELPKGCYSDDTQLRLSTSRCVRSTGEFDVEAFSKVELPVWLSYCLGAGRGTKSAANNLRRQSASWAANFVKGYVDGGGNGAAMRIQPHVWAFQPGSDVAHLVLDVARNSVCTHGHPRAIVGAALHALVLHWALQRGLPPGLNEQHSFLDWIQKELVKTMGLDLNLASTWFPQWSQISGYDFADAVGRTVDECRHDLDSAAQTQDCDRLEDTYRKLVDALDALNPKQRGSGTKTAILAGLVASRIKSSPEERLLVVSNALGSDTDTIGTMAGAILGAVTATPPPWTVADQAYIEAEADRTAMIAERSTRVKNFVYPDLLDWVPPKSAVGTVGLSPNGDDFVLAGLGPLRVENEKFVVRGNPPSALTWATLESGQRILVKVREQPKQLDARELPMQQRPSSQEEQLRLPIESGQTRLEPTVHNRGQSAPNPTGDLAGKPSIDELSQIAINSEFAPDVVGRCLLDAASGPEGVEHAVAYAAIIAKAKLVRSRRASGVTDHSKPTADGDGRGRK